MRSFGSILALAGLLAGCSSDQNRTQLHSVLRMEHVPPQALPTNAIVSEEISTNGLYGAAAGGTSESAAATSSGGTGSSTSANGGINTSTGTTRVGTTGTTTSSTLTPSSSINSGSSLITPTTSGSSLA